MDKYWLPQDVFEAGRRSLASRQRKPSKKLLAYLEKFQQDELTASTRHRPPSFAAQRDKIVAAMRGVFPEQGYRQLLNGRIADAPNFLEVLLTLHHVTHEIELTDNIGYDREEIATGVYTARKIPFAEFKIVGDTLRHAVGLSIETAVDSASKTRREASIVMEGRVVYAKLDDKRYRLSRALRSNMPPHSFMDYILSRPRTRIGRQDIKAATGSSDITELVRASGFDKELKAIFFSGTTEQEVYLQSPAYLTPVQAQLLKEREWAKVRKGGKA